MTLSFSRRTALKSAIGAGAAVGAGGTTLAAAPAAYAAPPVAAPAAGGDLATRAPRDRRFERRISALLRRMTLEEKLGQLQQLADNFPTLDAEARAGRLGSVLSLADAKKINALQRIAVEESRLGIPILFGLDVIHGYITTFPIPLAAASSFDPEVSRVDAEVGAREARTSGVRWTFAPMVDVSHEPRWGRIAEGSGEDPYLNTVLGVAKIRGYQGANYGAPGRLAACAKHFIAYGGAEGGRDYNTVDVSEQRLRNHYAPPFRAAVEAGVATFMASFNTVAGVPAHANNHVMTDILKREWGFDGFVVSDYTGIQELVPHGIAADGADAARLALNAGVDMEMVSQNIVQNGAALLRAGKISARRIDDAVTRILRVKFTTGLFENPYVDEAAEVTAPAAADRARARAAAGRSMVLLRNESGALPLAASVSRIAVVGPLGDDTKNLHGTWATVKGAAIPAVSVLAGIRAAAPSATVTFTAGSAVTGDDTSGFAAAVAAAQAADVVVLALGESADLSGEASARSDIRLPGVQEQLLAAVRDTGKPFVAVLFSGRPLQIAGWNETAPAILQAWHPGIEGGNAVADVLFGKVNPGGKLPVSMVRSVGQIPWYYNHENTGRPYDPDNKYTSKYLDLAQGPLYPFGFGLSYTSFAVSGAKLSTTRTSARSLRGGGTVEVTATVRNTGTVAGDEVVQLYIRDVVASIVQPVRRLRGFSRVTLAAGASRTVRFRLGVEDLGFWTNRYDGEYLLEPGAFELFVGTSSEAPAIGTLTVT